MKGRLRSISLLVGVLLAVALPAGFAIGQISDQGSDEGARGSGADPDPSTDPIAIGTAFSAAMKSGDQAAIDRAAAAVRREWLSRLGPAQRASAEAAPPEADVPAGTFAYLNPAITDAQVDQCRARPTRGHPDRLCELMALFREGKIEAGPYTRAEVAAVLGDELGR